MRAFHHTFLSLLICFFIIACGNKNVKQTVEGTPSKPKDSLEITGFTPPQWAYNANIYEVNIRQYTSEGTFNAFAQDLSRLKKIGVDIIWIMPIHPIGEKERKGTLGSSYSVKNYEKINPDFGTLDDFKNLVTEAHKSDMKVVIDWVANHTSHDNEWITQHPEWYTKDSTGAIAIPPGTDWSDVADLNYDNENMQTAMINAMKYWVKETDIDGFRCDVAGMVPIEFWIKARKELEKIKPLFMLAENGSPKIHDAFDMSYGWDFHHLMNQIAKGEKNCNDIETYFEKIKQDYKPNDWIMNFTSNHDENSWNGTAIERLGKGYRTFAVLSATIPGMPLVYNGQEVSLNKRLKFFEKDLIGWKKGKDISAFYSKLLMLRNQKKSLWSGTEGGELKRVHTNSDEAIFAFVRKIDNEKVFVVLNLSATKIEVSFLDKEYKGIYRELFTEEDHSLTNETRIIMPPWGYKVFVK